MIHSDRIYIRKDIVKEEKRQILNMNQEINNQIKPILQHIQSENLTVDKSEARKIRIKVAIYCLMDEELYKISYLGHLILCFGPKSTFKVMAKMHKGLYGNHLSIRSMQKGNHA